MLRNSAVLCVGLLLLAQSGVARAEPMTPLSTYSPRPSWTVGEQSTATLAASTAEVWACHGHSDPPHSALVSGGAGIVFDAYQDCSGNYDSQRVCVQLWSLDYYGAGTAISQTACGAWTVSPHAYFGRSLSCAAVGRGRVRYYTRATSYADPPSGIHSSSGESYSAYLC